MSTRNPKNVIEATDEIAKGVDEMQRGKRRLAKAAKFLRNHGNTPARSSDEYHYANKINAALRQNFTTLISELGRAAETYNLSTWEDKS